MLDFLKSNFDNLDIKMIVEDFECNFPRDGDREYGKELYDKCIDLGVNFESVEQKGGEGEGEDYWVVFKVTKGDESCLFRLDGWYASFHGHEFDDYMGFYEVKPVEKTIIVYE